MSLTKRDETTVVEKSSIQLCINVYKKK